jgi:hypothetical protein
MSWLKYVEVMSVSVGLTHPKKELKQFALTLDPSASSALSSKSGSIVIGDALTCLTSLSGEPNMVLGVDHGGKRSRDTPNPPSATLDFVVWLRDTVLEVSRTDFPSTMQCRSALHGPDFGFPAREDGLYLHSAPQARHREHTGMVLLHLTLARKQVSQEALSFTCRGFEGSRLADSCMLMQLILTCWSGKKDFEKRSQGDMKNDQGDCSPLTLSTRSGE